MTFKKINGCKCTTWEVQFWRETFRFNRRNKIISACNKLEACEFEYPENILFMEVPEFTSEGGPEIVGASFLSSVRGVTYFFATCFPKKCLNQQISVFFILGDFMTLYFSTKQINSCTIVCIWQGEGAGKHFWSMTGGHFFTIGNWLFPPLLRT